MTKVLFFDTETNDQAKSYQASYETPSNWPRLIQLGWIVTDEEGNVLDEQKHYITSDGFTIAPGAHAVNGITLQDLEEKGKPLGDVMLDFLKHVEAVDLVVAHNIDFDKPVVASELFHALNLPVSAEDFFNKNSFCTMKETTHVTNIRVHGRSHPKWPRLEELHTHLFGEGFSGAHDALADTRACARCFWQLVEDGFLVLPK